jgi:hypothetical protein
MSVGIRQAVERRIIQQVIIDLLDDDKLLAIDHGGEDNVIEIKDAGPEALDEMMACDDERLYVFKSRHALDRFIRMHLEGDLGECSGYVYFVYGNDGYDVISDYSTNLEPQLKNAVWLGDEIDAGRFSIAPTRTMGAGKRQCFFIDTGSFVEGRGYIPSLVTEDEPGHQPMSGRTGQEEPWYWGPDLKMAQATADHVNMERWGLTKSEATKIVASSMGASRGGMRRIGSR